MGLVYPSFQALRLADQIIEAVAGKVSGYQGRLELLRYWRLNGGILFTFELAYRVTQQRWDVLHGEAVTPRVGIFSAGLPAGITVRSSSLLLHPRPGRQRGMVKPPLLPDGTPHRRCVWWLETLLATALDPQVNPPAAFPALTEVERILVLYAVNKLPGQVHAYGLHSAFRDTVSYSALAGIARRWGRPSLLTGRPAG